MKSFQTTAAGFACLLMLPHAALSQSPPAGAEVAAQVAAEQIVIGKAEQRMILVVWQRADSVENSPGVNAASMASMGGKGVPLVIISHGTGAGPMAHVDTAEALAGAGFVVVAPMHRGDNFQDDSSVGRPEWMANRSHDISRTIDFMLKAWPGRAELDGNRIGIFGFSAGATTALISAGGVPDLGRIAPHCAVQREFVCNIMAPQADGTGAPPAQWVHDRRVAAAVIAAPGLGFAFEPSGLDAVTVPVQLWAGAADETVPFATNAGVVQRLLRSTVDFHNVENAVHLSFLAPCGPEGPPQLCQDNQGFDRTAFHRDFNRSIIDFFHTHLQTGDGGRR